MNNAFGKNLNTLENNVKKAKRAEMIMLLLWIVEIICMLVKSIGLYANGNLYHEKMSMFSSAMTDGLSGYAMALLLSCLAGAVLTLLPVLSSEVKRRKFVLPGLLAVLVFILSSAQKSVINKAAVVGFGIIQVRFGLAGLFPWVAVALMILSIVCAVLNNKSIERKFDDV